MMMMMMIFVVMSKQQLEPSKWREINKCLLLQSVGNGAPAPSCGPSGARRRKFN